MFSEIKLVTVGVKDLDRSIAFYADAFGYEEISRTRVDHEALAEAWRIPAGIAGRFAIMGIQGTTSGLLRLVEWTPAGDHVWATPARLHDLGPYAVNFRVKDINAAWDLLGQSGAREKSKPTYWEVEQNMAAWDARCTDPDGTVLGVFQVVGEIERALGPFPSGHDVSEVQTLAINCRNARRSETFYRGLSFEPLFDREIDYIWDFLGLPKGTKLHRINLIMRGEYPVGRVELAEYVGVGLPAKSLKARTAAPARGPLMMSLQVTDLEDACRRIKGLHAKQIGTARYDCPPFGRVTAATHFGPDDEVIELFQPE
jgi:catechol 2,3-dioxygenase-like lactoylglutathione lyase family enzyme